MFPFLQTQSFQNQKPQVFGGAFGFMILMQHNENLNPSCGDVPALSPLSRSALFKPLNLKALSVQ